MKKVVVYDSWTGNTEKIAKLISQTLNCDIFRVKDAPLDLQKKYQVIFLGSPNIRGNPTEKISEFIDKAEFPQYVAIFLTYGAPLWGIISSYLFIKKIKKRLKSRGCIFLGKFKCPGFHQKFKTYRNRPSKKDYAQVKLFLERVLKALGERE